MLFSVPVVYEAQIIRPRCRNIERVLCGEWIEVHVAEVSDLDAPVALRWVDKFARENIQGFKETRWYADRHFEPACYTASGREDEHLDAERVDQLCRSGNSYANPLVSGHDWQIRDFVQGKYKAIADLEVRSVASCSREEAIEKAHLNASETLIVDGMVWTLRDEPVYKVSRSGGFRDDYIFLDVVGLESIGDRQKDGVFRADRFEDACEYAASLTANPGNLIERRIDVFVPESVRHDDETPAFLEAAGDALGWQKDRLSSEERPVIEAWLDLRDAFNAAISDTSSDNLAELERVLTSYRDVALDNWYQERIDKALRRWSMRPMSIELDHGLSLA